MKSELSPALTPAGTGRVLKAYGDEVVILLSGEQTGGRLVLFTDVTPPGGGPPPHYHVNEDEWWYVLEGRASFFIEGRWRDVTPGSAVFAPRGSVHTFKNTGNQPLKQLITTSPAGFDKFYARSAEEFARPGGPDMARLMTIAAGYGIHFVNP